MSKETEIKTKVFAKIRTGDVSMRPKIYFTARIVLLAFLAVVVLVFAMLVLSFAFFSIHESGEQFLLGFGQLGLMALVTLFPWWYFLLTVALILLLDRLLRYFKFGYRVSVLEIFLVALTVVVMAGIAINFTPLHATLLDTADRDELPIVGHLYEEIHDSHQAQGVYRGVIYSVQDNEFTLVHQDNDKDSDDGTSTVMVPPGFDSATLQVGERVYVAGKVVQGVVRAYGIQALSADK